MGNVGDGYIFKCGIEITLHGKILMCKKIYIAIYSILSNKMEINEDESINMISCISTTPSLHFKIKLNRLSLQIFNAII